MLNLRQQEDPDTQYVMDYVAMGMKTQDLDNRQMSRKMVKSVTMTPVLHNSIRGEDPQFDQCWEDTIHGRATKEVEEEEDKQEPEEPHANIEIKNDFQPQFDKSAKPQQRRNDTRAHTTIQNLLTVISEQEMEIEKLRQRVVGECPEFNVVDAFRRLDSHAKGQVTKE